MTSASNQGRNNCYVSCRNAQCEYTNEASFAVTIGKSHRGRSGCFHDDAGMMASLSRAYGGRSGNVMDVATGVIAILAGALSAGKACVFGLAASA